MGRPRHSRSSHRFCAELERAHGNCDEPVHSVVVGINEQVLRLESALRQGQRAQWVDSSRPLAGRVGKEGHHRISSPISAGRVSPADVHDAGSRRGRCESGQRLESLKPSGIITALEPEAVTQRHRLSTAAPTPRTLACRRFLHQYRRHVLLLVQRPGWSQPLYHALGDPRIDERIRCRDHPSASSREISQRDPADHLRQRTAVHCERFQRIYPYLRHDACEDIAILSTVERKDRAVAPVVKVGMYSSRSAIVDRGCQAARRGLRRSLQYSPSSQCDWLHCAERQTGRTPSGDLRRTRSEARCCSIEAATPSPCLRAWQCWTGTTTLVKLIAPGEAEAGSAGKQPCRGIIRWAHRYDENGACGFVLAPRFNSSDDRPSCLKNPINKCPLPYLFPAAAAVHISAPRCRFYLTINGCTPFPAEPGQGLA